MISKGLSEKNRVSAFRLTVSLLILVSQLIACIFASPVDESNELFHDAKHFEGELGELPARFYDELLPENQTEVRDIRNDVEKPKRIALYWQHLTEGIRQTMAPTLEYVKLLQRYHNWYRGYTALERSTGGSMKKAMQVMREEYARANELLSDEDCPLDKTERDFENMDFVYRTLKVVIDDLEKILHELEEKRRLSSDEGVFVGELTADSTSEVDEESINRAMERVKRTAVKTAKEVLKREAFVLAKMVAVNAATIYLQGAIAESAIDSLGYLAPLVGMLSSGDISLASAYLRDLELRVALSVFQHINPIPRLRCNSGDGGKEKSE